MARIPRSKLEPGWYHCINRGVNRNTIFQDHDDYAQFTDWLQNYRQAFSLDIGAFCLMPNHWHIMLKCNRVEDMSAFFRRILNLHTTSFRAKYQQIGYGPIYQGRFKSFRIKDENALNTVFSYIENNPVRAKLVNVPENWMWSSASIGWGQSGD